MTIEDNKMVIIYGMGACAALATLGLGAHILYKDATKLDAIGSSANINVQQQNVLGNEKPEIFIEVNGVKYYSHLDGKDISDLVKK